jgi:hypothetical protein
MVSALTSNRDIRHRPGKLERNGGYEKSGNPAKPPKVTPNADQATTHNH